MIKVKKSGSKHGKKIFVDILCFAFVLCMAYVFLFPVLYMISVAFREPSSVNDPSVVWLPKAFSMQTLKQTMKAMDYLPSLWVTIKMSVGSTLAALVSCSLVGYALARYRFHGRNLIMIMVFLTIIVPPVATMNASYMNFRYFNFAGLLKLLSPITGFPSINLLNSEWTFILPALFANGLRCGLFIFLFRQFFSGLPGELEEAARIDGCNALRTFTSIIVPMSRPVYITVMLFSFVWIWNDFYTSALFFLDSPRPLSVMLYNLSSLLDTAGITADQLSMTEHRLYLQAGSLLTIAVPLILYLFTQRYFTESIERTGLVG